jgi:hypothetical protein
MWKMRWRGVGMCKEERNLCSRGWKISLHLPRWIVFSLKWKKPEIMRLGRKLNTAAPLSTARSPRGSSSERHHASLPGALDRHVLRHQVTSYRFRLTPLRQLHPVNEGLKMFIILMKRLLDASARFSSRRRNCSSCRAGAAVSVEPDPAPIWLRIQDFSENIYLPLNELALHY